MFLPCLRSATRHTPCACRQGKERRSSSVCDGGHRRDLARLETTQRLPYLKLQNSRSGCGTELLKEVNCICSLLRL